MNRYRIKKLDIEGFRIYSEKKQINFFNNLTVIYGRNGRGKTSLQDAVSWLFNNDIVRYAMYNREWSRVKKTHTRSLLYPEKSTSITGYFENLGSSKVEQLTRDESNLICPEILSSWFENEQKDDLLWANSLSQSKLQELASARGRDRLENLAPLLDLTQVNKQVKDIEELIRELKEEIKGKVILEKMISKDESGMLSKVRDYAEVLQKKLSSIIEMEKNPSITSEVYEEIKAWRSWLENILKNIYDKQSTIQRNINNINEKYFMIEPLQDNQDIESVKILEKELNSLLVKQKEIKVDTQGLEHQSDLLNKDIIDIGNYFVEFKKYENSIIPYLNTKEILKSKITNHDEAIRNSEGIQNEVNVLTEKIDKVNNSYTKLLNEKKLIEDRYKEFLVIKGAIANKEEIIKKEEEWLKINSLESNDELLESLEKRLTDIGGSTEELAKQKLELEESCDVLHKYINSQNCPLCGLEHDSPEKLEKAILKQKDYWNSFLFNLGEEIAVIIEKITEVRKFNFLKGSKERAIMENKEQIKKLQLNIVNIINELEGFFSLYKLNYVSTYNLTENTFIDLLDTNKSIIRQIEQDRTNYKNLSQQKLDLLEKIDREIQEERKVFTDNDERIEELKQNISSIKKQINSKLSKYDYAPEELSLEDCTHYLKELLKNVTQNLEEKRNKLNTINLEDLERKLYFQYDTQFKIMEQNTSEIKNLFAHLDIIEQNLKELYNKSKLEEELQELNKKLEYQKEERKKKRQIQTIETNKEIGKMSRRISAIFEMLSDVSPWKTIKSDAIVPDERERTNLIFRPIPHNIKSGFKEYIEKTNSNSTFAFSGGQLSLLGLSIFLSQVADENKRYDKNEPLLDTLFLDDPIQMLDTLRDDALVSLLCDIARDRQVIISTSDINFANKLILSSRPMWNNKPDSCGVVYYQQLKESGPEISQIEPYSWISSQRIYLPDIRQAK